MIGNALVAVGYTSSIIILASSPEKPDGCIRRFFSGSFMETIDSHPQRVGAEVRSI